MSMNVYGCQIYDDGRRCDIEIGPDALTLFRQFLTEEEERTSLCLAAQAKERRLILPAFEVRTVPFSLATLARIFEYDETMISLVEEAQFRRLCLIVSPLADGGASVSLSDTTDAQFAFDMDANSSSIAPVAATMIPRLSIISPYMAASGGQDRPRSPFPG